MVDAQLLQEILGVARGVFWTSVRCQGFWNSKAVEAGTKEGDEVVSATLAVVDLKPVAEPVNDKAEVVSCDG